MRGKPVIQGTDDHRSVVKAMKDSPVNGNAFTKAMADAGGNYEKAKEILENSPGNMNSPADAMDSPADAMESPAKILPVLRTAGSITKITPKIVKGTKNIIKGGAKKADDVIEYVKKTPKTLGQKLKKALGYGTTGVVGVGIGSELNEKSNEAKQKIEEEVSSGNKGGSKSGGGDPYAKAKKKDQNLDSYIRERKKYKKGSDEYNRIQNKINEAYGVKKRHPVSSEGGKKMHAGREVGKSGTEYRPGVGITEVKVKKNKKTGETTKAVRKFTGVDGSKGKTVIKSDKTGDLKSIKRKKTSAEGDVTKGREKYYRRGVAKGTIKKKVVKEDGRRTVTKTDRKGNVTTKSRRTIKGFLTGKGKKKKEDQ